MPDNSELAAIDLPDGGNVYRQKKFFIGAGGSDAPNPTNASQDLVQGVSSQQSFMDGLQSAWDSTTGKSLLVGGAILAIGLIVYFAERSSHSNNQLAKEMTQAQAQVAQQQLDQQLTTTAKVFQKAGYNTGVIAQEQHRVALVYGTQIVENTIPSSAPGVTPQTSVYVTGTSAPTHYASLQNVDTHAYINSLSVHPNAQEITKNRRLFTR